MVSHEPLGRRDERPRARTLSQGLFALSDSLSAGDVERLLAVGKHRLSSDGIVQG